PKRLYRSDFPDCPMPSIASEINLIETFSNTDVIGLTLNHEDMSLDETHCVIDSYTTEFGIPVTDALSQPVEHLLHIVTSAFPMIARKLAAKG
ncbi:DUF1611 domain-containing protein, partial [Vibrio cyclitrophicus]